MWLEFRRVLFRSPKVQATEVKLHKLNYLKTSLGRQSQNGGVGRCGVSVSPQLGCVPATGEGLWHPRRWEEPQGETAACRILVHEPRVRLKLLRWELQVRTTGLTENLRPQGIFTGVRSHGVPHLSIKTQLYPIAYKPQSRKSQAKQPVRQEHSLTREKQ